jgi:hypothetical protein
MARSVTLSEEAFRALREEKRPGESDSDVVLRLRREARRKTKDPTAFLRSKTMFHATPGKLTEFSREMLAADVRKAEWLARFRSGES